jgi:hypothetical protein
MTLQPEERGKIRIIDHFMQEVPSHWNLQGVGVTPTIKGLLIESSISMRQTARTTFGFFRVRLELHLQDNDKFAMRFHTANEVIELIFDASNKAHYKHPGRAEKSIDVPSTLTVQWILNDERYSLQVIGQGITTLASRTQIASFSDEAYVMELSSSITTGSVTILESYYESVNE